jgi:hypothetical protein
MSLKNWIIMQGIFLLDRLNRPCQILENMCNLA